MSNQVIEEKEEEKDETEVLNLLNATFGLNYKNMNELVKDLITNDNYITTQDVRKYLTVKQIKSNLPNKLNKQDCDQEKDDEGNND